MSNLNNQNETLDSLDETLDDLADLPQTKPFPAGAHSVNMKVKKDPKKSMYIVELTHNEVIELSNPNTPEEELPKQGDKSTVFIHTKKKDGSANELGQGQLKVVLKPLAELYNTNSIAEILDNAKSGVDVAVVVSIRKSKDEQYDDAQDIKAVSLM